MTDVSRRKFIQNAGVAALVGATIPVFGSTTTNTKRALRIAHITDVHLDTRPVAGRNFKKVLIDINAMKDKPDLIINTGDSVFKSDGRTYEEAEVQWNLLLQMLKEYNRIPIKSCIGNHDVWFGADAKTDEAYKTNKRYHKNWVQQVLNLPGRFYSAEMNGWYFVALDSINENEYSLDKEQTSWLTHELARIPVDKPICIFSHVSILSIIPLLRALKDEKLEDIRYPASRMHKDALSLKNLFHQHKNVKLCLSGHTHQVDEVDFLNIKYLCGGAVSGNWWGDNRDSYVFDEFPPAYTIIDLFEDGSIRYERIIYPFIA